MKLFKKSEKAAEDQPIQIGTPWTKGEQLKTTALRAVLWTVILSGPCLGVLAVVQGQSHNPAVAAPEALSEPQGREEAEEIAVRGVTDWLSSSRDVTKEMTSFYPRTSLPSAALEVRDSAAFKADFREGVWHVIVAATVVTTAPAEREGEPPVVTEQRRYFQQPVLVDGEGAAWIADLPAEVPGPRVEAAEQSSYTLSINLSDPLVSSAQGFFEALLTGTGDIERYVAPGVEIDSVHPAPFTAVRILQARADGEVPTHSDGATANVMVRVEASSGNDTATTFDYELTLISRSGRWEIAAIGGAPTTTQLPSTAPSLSATPSSAAAEDGRSSTDEDNPEDS